MKVKTLAVSVNKGGAGKTTIAVHLAWYLSERKNKKVIVMDMDDVQYNAMKWLSGKSPSEEEMRKGFFKAGKIEKYGSVSAVWMPDEIPGGYDVCIADGRPTTEQLLSLKEDFTADGLILPFRGRMSRDGIGDVVVALKELNWRIPCLLVPMMQGNSVQSKYDIAMAAKVGFPMTKSWMFWSCMGNAEEKGVPIWKLPWSHKIPVIDRLEEVAKWAGL